MKSYYKVNSIEWIVQLCFALKYCHDNKVLHLDIKTANVFLDEFDNVKLGDFGMAKNLENTNQQMTDFAGTPLYFPPEIINGQSYSFKADVWSLGVVFFELANLKVPFYETNFPKLLLRICTKQPPALPEHYSEELKCFILKLLEKDQNKRMSMSEVLEEPYIKNSMKKFDLENDQMTKIKRLSNLVINDDKLHQDFNNLRTNRYTIFASDAKKVLEEAQNSAKPSRFRNVQNDVFNSSIQNSKISNMTEIRNELGLGESVIVNDSELKKKIEQSDFQKCLREINDSNIHSTSDVEEPITSSRIRHDFVEFGSDDDKSDNHFMKNTLLNASGFQMDYTVGSNKIVDTLKNNSNDYQNDWNLEVDQSEVRKQELRAKFLGKMCVMSNETKPTQKNTKPVENLKKEEDENEKLVKKMDADNSLKQSNGHMKIIYIIS